MAELDSAAVKLAGLVLRGRRPIAALVEQAGIERGLGVPEPGRLLEVGQRCRRGRRAAQSSRRDVRQPVVGVAAQRRFLDARQWFEQGAGPDEIARHPVGVDKSKGEVQRGDLCMRCRPLQGGGDLALYAGG